MSPDVRTCKHLKELLGTELEEARVRAGDGEKDGKDGNGTRRSTRKRKNDDDGDAPKKQARKSATSKASKPIPVPDDDNGNDLPDEEMDDNNVDLDDPLACINGIKRTSHHMS